ncbi:MAG: UDP-N-acetylglucosamine 2-epimerase (non-hydrolyzing) [Phycisphaerales bacterium]|nr:UDP-N-acetylglucosamine 2-epimerase (non-hydrolyzing) [Phycisphaerales bacterium]
MKSARRICILMGTRPEVIKCWPVVRALSARREFELTTILTGQHRELARQAAARLGIDVTMDLDVMTADQSLDSLTGRLCERLGTALRAARPDRVLVQGDTTSAFAGALAAFHAGIPVAHVEAGLRTDDVRQPFPEEMYRRLISRLCDVHFAPTVRAREALLREGVPAASVHVTGNTGIDALRITSDELDRHPIRDELRDALAGAKGSIVAVTVHRRENRACIEDIASALRALGARHPNARFVIPVHPAPQVRAALEPALSSCAQCKLLPALDYGEFVTLLCRCRFVLTDSGGVQEEAPFLGKPVLVMRRTTERPEAVEAGVARLVGEQAGEILAAAHELLSDDAAYARMARRVSPYGDGRAAERILEILSSSAGSMPAAPLGLPDPMTLPGVGIQTQRASLSRHHAADATVAISA